MYKELTVGNSATSSLSLKSTTTLRNRSLGSSGESVSTSEPPGGWSTRGGLGSLLDSVLGAYDTVELKGVKFMYSPG